MRLFTRNQICNIFLNGFLITCCLNSHGQTRFNVRDSSSYTNSLFVGVTELEDGYLVIGKGVLWENSEFLFPMFSGIYSNEGVIQSSQNYYNEQIIYVPNDKSGISYINENFGYSSFGATLNQNTESAAGFIANFNEEGDTISVILYHSPYLEEFGEDFIAPLDIVPSTNDDNSFFVSTNIYKEGTQTDCWIQRMTPEGDNLWSYIYATDSNPDACKALLPKDNGGVIALLRQTGFDLILIDLDADGNEINTFETGLNFSINEALWSSEDYIIGAGVGLAEDGFISGRVVKMDTEANILWDTIIGLGQSQSFQNQFYKIVHSGDGKYVAGGTKKEFIPEEEITEQSGTARSQGWLVKIDDDGNVMWERKYHFIDTPSDTHTLNDLKATSDGGYIFCGESTDYDSSLEFSEGPPQQGWLVKVDEYGCLVEGCQLSDNINVIEQNGTKEYFKAGPIPAGQFLNVYQSQNDPLSIYQLINQYGQVVEEFPALSKGTTMMLDVSKFSAGSYLLVLRIGNEVLQSEKIIVE